MGVVGGGGIGDFAVRVGYQRLNTVLCILYVIMIALVFILQMLELIAQNWTKRK